MVVDLPAPLGPRKPTTCPLRHVEGHVADGGVIAVILGQVADVDHSSLLRLQGCFRLNPGMMEFENNESEAKRQEAGREE